MHFATLIVSFMTLKEFYDQLPGRSAPKADFVREIVATCGVEHVTAKFWVKGKTTPSNPDHRRLLSKVTGIPEEELFPKLKKAEQ